MNKKPSLNELKKDKIFRFKPFYIFIAFVIAIGTGIHANNEIAVEELIYDDDKCQNINITNYDLLLGINNDRDTILRITNPFSNIDCVNVYYDYKLYKNPSNEFFGGEPDKKIAFLSKIKKGPQVAIVDSKEGGKNYYFMNLDDDNDDSFTYFKKGFLKNSLLLSYFDEFILLHEIAHLNPSLKSNGYTISEKEVASDISALLVLATKYDFKNEDTIKFLNGLLNIRRGNSRDKVYRDRDHYDSDSYANARNFFNNIYKSKSDYKISSLNEAGYISKMIIKEDDTEKMVKDAIKINQYF